MLFESVFLPQKSMWIKCFNRQDFKAHANNVLLWLRISAVSRKCNSTAEIMYVALYSILMLIECGL